MNPQAVTVGARLGRKLNVLLIAAGARSPDPVAFYGGLLASIAGAVAGVIGPQTAAELLRISLTKLDGTPQLELPPGVRLAMAAAEEPAAANDPLDIRAIVDGANADQLEAMRRVVSVLAAKADIGPDKLVELLDAALLDVRQGKQTAP